MIDPAGIPEERLARARQIADAVLYEGYILYPYRPSATKNRQRWTFGGLCPEEYCAAHRGAEASAMQTECIVRGTEQTAIAIRLRFLHLAARQVSESAPGATAKPEQGVPGGVRPVEALRLDGRTYATWQEAVEREVDGAGLLLGNLEREP